MTNCSVNFYNVYNLVGPTCIAHPIGMWSGVLTPVYNLCRKTLYNTRSGV